MKKSSILNQISVLFHRSKALRAVVFVFGLLFFMGNFSTVSAQTPINVTARISDTVGWGVDINHPDNHVLLSTFVNDVVCVVTQGFSRVIQVGRAGGRSWVDAFFDGNVRFTAPVMPYGLDGWVIAGARPADDGIPFDEIMISFVGNPAEDAFLERQLGGNFVFELMEADEPVVIATLNIPFRPVVGPVETIFMDSIFCQGATVRAWVYRRPPGSFNSAINEFYDGMIFRWTVLSDDGTAYGNNFGNTEPITSHFLGDTSFLIRNFDPNRHHRVTVQRVFCRPGAHMDFTHPYGRLAGVPYQTRDFADDPDIIVVTNPPLDTTANNEFGVRQDTLYRLEWNTVTTRIPNPAYPDPDGLEPDSIYLSLSSWVPIPMTGDDNASGGNVYPVCVNYGTPSFFTVTVPGTQNLSVPTGFDPQREAHSSGYLFFQVGNDMDTLVDYMWDYDPLFLERVFVGVPIQVGGGTPFNWWGVASNQRWTTRTYFPGMPALTDENSLVDPATQANFGWFGQPYPTGNPNTFRAAFRVRALDENDFLTHDEYLAARRQPITVGVRPVCRFCPQVPDVEPFQNDSLTGNVGRAWDTIRPFTDFDILIVENLTWSSSPRPALDTACQGVQMNFQLEATEGTTFSWEREDFATQYNITSFSGHGFSGVMPAINPNIHTHSQWSSLAPNAAAQITGSANPTLPATGSQLFTPFMRTFTPRNHCFVRRAPTLTLVENTTTNERDSIVFANPNDTIWHRAVAFWTERLASEPHIWDSTLNRRLNPITHMNPDTIFICRSQILNLAGDGSVGYALTYTLLTTRGDNNRLMRDPRNNPENPVYWGANLREVFPAVYYHGYFNDPTGFGNPGGSGIQTDWLTSSEIDHPLYTFQTTFAIRPAHFATPEAGLVAGSSGTLMFAAQTRCGRGVAATIAYFILDTISANPNLMYSFTHPGEQVYVFDNLQHEYICAWTSMFFYVADSTDWPRRRQAMHWWVTADGWDSIREVTVTGENVLRGVEVKFSEAVGQVGVNIVNRCGGSRAVYTSVIEPIPHFRVPDDWIDFPICQDEILRFEFEDVEEFSMDTLFIRFPENPHTNWSVIGNSVFGSDAWAPYGKGTRDTLTHANLFPPVRDSFDITVVVQGGGEVNGSSTNFVIRVRAGDNFQFAFNPNSGSIVSGVVVDGENLPDAELLTGINLYDIQENHTIYIAFLPGTEPDPGDLIHPGALPDNPRDRTGVYFDVLVNDSVGGRQHILVSWETAVCVGQRDRHWDTVQIFTNTFPTMPLKDESWDKQEYHGYFRFCLRDTVWLGVKPAPKDTNQTNHYVWTFPANWEPIESTANNDSIRFVIGVLNNDELGNRLEVDTITVQAKSYICDTDNDARREFATLTVLIRVMDTIVFDMNFIRNVATDDALFDPMPCEETELILFARHPYTYDSIRWQWGDAWDNLDNDISSAPSIFGGWEFLEVDGVEGYLLLPDTFAVMPTSGTTLSLYAQVTIHNRCGPSRSDTIRLVVSDEIASNTRVSFNYPINTLTAPADTTFTLCEGETVRFSVNPVPYAGQYIWNFPWYPNRDTSLLYSREFIPTATGRVWVIAINACSYTTYSDTIYIADILPAPGVPSIHNFGTHGTATILGQEFMIVDTVCLRQHVLGWEIGLHYSDVDYEGDWDAFNWMVFGAGGISEDIDDIFEFEPSSLDSIFSIRPADASVEARLFNTLIGVSAVRAQCPTAPGDTLRILLTSIDTIPFGDLGIGDIIDTSSTGFHCPGSIAMFHVEHNRAMAYRWFLPEGDTTWIFVGHDYTVRYLDTYSDTVHIEIGDSPGQIGVQTTTGLFCRDDVVFTNYDTLWLEIEFHPVPVLDGFSFPADGVCSETAITITADLDPSYSPADGFRFIVHKHIVPGSLITDTLDTIYQASHILTIDPLEDWAFDSITVSVQAFNYSRCPNLDTMESNILTGTFPVFNSPEVFLIGSRVPCFGDDLLYIIVPSDPSVTFGFTAFPSPGVEVTEYLPDSVRVVFNGDSVLLSFFNISSGLCPAFPPNETIFRILTDEAHGGGGFDFQVIYHNLVCSDVERFPLELVNLGGAPPELFEQEWYFAVFDTIWTTIDDVEVIERIDTVPGVWINNTQSIQIPQSDIQDQMNFMVVATYWRCVSDGVVSDLVDFDTTLFVTVTAVDPLVAQIGASVVRIVGNRADFVRVFNAGFDSVYLGENLRFVGGLEGNPRPANFPHFEYRWWGDFESYLRTGDTLRDRETFSGTVFFDEQLFFFEIRDTSAYGCVSMDSIYIHIQELTGSSLDDENVFGDVPNAFTPHNQDGVNDIFMPGVDRITILNRWGVVIYHATHPPTPGTRSARDGWDGREARTNRMVDRGDYFFIIEIHRPNVTNPNEPPYKHTKTGVVTVL